MCCSSAFFLLERGWGDFEFSPLKHVVSMMRYEKNTAFLREGGVSKEGVNFRQTPPTCVEVAKSWNHRPYSQMFGFRVCVCVCESCFKMDVN